MKIKRPKKAVIKVAIRAGQKAFVLSNLAIDQLDTFQMFPRAEQRGMAYVLRKGTIVDTIYGDEYGTSVSGYAVYGLDTVAPRAKRVHGLGAINENIQAAWFEVFDEIHLASPVSEVYDQIYRNWRSQVLKTLKYLEKHKQARRAYLLIMAREAKKFPGGSFPLDQLGKIHNRIGNEAFGKLYAEIRQEPLPELIHWEPRR